MKHVKRVGMVLAAAVVAATLWALAGRAGAQQTRLPPVIARWEYATAYIGEGKPVVREQSQVTTLRPPSSSLSTGQSRRQDQAGVYTRQIVPERNHDVFALNLLGAAGWEAVSMSPRGEGFLVLLKRPVLVR